MTRVKTNALKETRFMTRVRISALDTLEGTLIRIFSLCAACHQFGKFCFKINDDVKMLFCRL